MISHDIKVLQQQLNTELSISARRHVVLKVGRALSNPGRVFRVWPRRAISRLLFRSSCRKLGVDDGARRSAPPAYSREVARAITDSCADAGIIMEKKSVPPGDLLEFVREVDYKQRYPQYLSFYRHAIRKKVLEQFLTLQTLVLNRDDVFMDVASEISPFAEIPKRMTGCSAFVQDLSFEPGVQGNRIGSPASSIPMEDETITAMSLHCSLEHFEGNEDSGFVQEAARLLVPGGKLLIVPLYIWSEPLNCFDPYLARKNGVRLEAGSIKLPLWNYGNPFVRYYSLKTLKTRVLDIASPYFETRMIFIENYDTVDALGYVAFALYMVRK